MRTPLITGLAVVLVLTGVTLWGHDYRLREQELTIDLGDRRLHALLTLPKTGVARGVVVMVHGDGPIDATHDGLYLPWFEAAADAGYATLSWDKPGVGESTGNWLDQGMEDRARETSAVIDWAMRHSAVPADRIVLWGASQAGWVVPAVAASRTEIDAVVLVSPAVNWLRQGRYHLLAELEDEGAAAEERASAIVCSDRTRSLLRQGADYGTYASQTCDDEPMSKDRWKFVSVNFKADATVDLEALAGRATPVHLMVGEHDRHVDVSETEAVYRRHLAGQLTVKHLDAAHSMARPVVEESDVVGLAVGTLWPRALMAPGALDSYRDFLRRSG